MTNVNSLQIIDSLGEITRHRDREIVEKSLLKTLGELAPNQEFRLFKVFSDEVDGVALGLLAYSINGYVETSGFHIKRYDLPKVIKQCVLTVIERKEIQQVVDEKGRVSHIVYPTFDHCNEIFAILIHVCGDGYEWTLQRFVNGLLKVYSNYLALIDDNQRDKLTQLLNRDTLEREITRILLKNNEHRSAMTEGVFLKRRKDSLTHWLCMLDIDHFKRVNDNFGHLFGDEVLILVARQMQRNIRGEEDLVYRYGGEEFVILLQEQDRELAKKAFDRLRADIERRTFPQVGVVTVSIGMVQATDQSGSGQLILQADQALRYAKEHGRNQVCCYEELLESALIEKAEQNLSSGNLEFF